MTVTAAQRPLPDPAAPIALHLDALLSWPHRRGGRGRALLQVRATEHPDGPTRLWVVASQLRESPRGLDVLGDFAGLATTAAAELIGPALDRAAIGWFSHHGTFSSYDPTGPETFYEIPLRWNGGSYDPAALAAPDQRLTPDQARALTRALSLDPVEHALEVLNRTQRPAAPAG